MLQLNYDIYSNPLNNNEWSFPLFECIHIAMFAMSIGTIAIVDFRMLGLGLRRQTPAELLKATSLWTLIGLIVVITSGMVIWSSDPLRYYYSPPFRFKIITLLVAVIYNYTVHRKAASSNARAPWGPLAASLSLLIWVSIVFSGIFYAFW